jgi:hypothetical protein
MFAVIKNNAIVAYGKARDLWPDVSFGASGPRADWLAERGAVAVRQDPPHNPETHFLRMCDPYLLEGIAYNREVVAIPTPEPEPQWVAFGAEVMAAPAINTLLGTAIANGAAALAMGLSVGLGKAADGDSRVFLQAWDQANQLGLISAELTEAIAAMAAAYNLPADFVAALAP